MLNLEHFSERFYRVEIKPNSNSELSGELPSNQSPFSIRVSLTSKAFLPCKILLLSNTKI